MRFALILAKMAELGERLRTAAKRQAHPNCLFTEYSTLKNKYFLGEVRCF